MSMQDPVADMFTRMRNVAVRGKKSTQMPSSRFKIELVKLLQKEGFVSSYEVSEGAKPILTVSLNYYEGRAVIDSIKRVSRPGLRIYHSVKNVPKVLGGLGIAIISTSKGLMTDRQARREGIGGEVIAYVQ